MHCRRALLSLWILLTGSSCLVFAQDETPTQVTVQNRGGELPPLTTRFRQLLRQLLSKKV
jgi:hypothetical protein